MALEAIGIGGINFEVEEPQENAEVCSLYSLYSFRHFFLVVISVSIMLLLMQKVTTWKHLICLNLFFIFDLWQVVGPQLNAEDTIPTSHLSKYLNERIGHFVEKNKHIMGEYKITIKVFSEKADVSWMHRK